ncbi:MAG: MmgE/PrpD family protein [Halobacteriota archaeon]|uniref:MmgE/PrpD family protein n=1 Tax=Natronomonas sp. TaxID=2184060 RepID=UPI003975F3B8
MELSSTLLAEYANEIDYDDLPPDVIEMTERLVLDSLGCCIGAYTSEPSKILREVYGDRSPAPDEAGATVLCDGSTVPVEYAALINGLLVRYLDYNDCYISSTSVCHPSDHIPPLLAVAEAEGSTGEELIEAIVLAYEIQCRGVDTGVVWNNGFDYVTWGLYSTAAAAGKLMGLSESELVSAIGVAGTSTNGLLPSRLGEVSMWKGVAHPYVCHSAIQACQMARAGLTGPPAVFEGEGGFFDTVAGGPVEIDELGGRDGADYRVTRTNIKPFACGYFMQSPITGVQEIVEEHDIDPETITDIEIRTFDQAVQVLASPEKWDTEKLNRETADHSIPYAIAAAIVFGDVSPREFAPDCLADERVHELMATVSVEADDELNEFRAENAGSIPSTAHVTASGETYGVRTDYPIGHAERPMSDERLEQKASAQADPYLTRGAIESVFEDCYGLSDLSDLSALADRTLV